MSNICFSKMAGAALSQFHAVMSIVSEHFSVCHLDVVLMSYLAIFIFLDAALLFALVQPFLQFNPRTYKNHIPILQHTYKELIYTIATELTLSLRPFKYLEPQKAFVTSSEFSL